MKSTLMKRIKRISLKHVNVTPRCQLHTHNVTYIKTWWQTIPSVVNSKQKPPIEPGTNLVSLKQQSFYLKDIFYTCFFPIFFYIYMNCRKVNAEFIKQIK